MRKIKNLSADAALACDFQNLLVVQSDEAETGENSLGMKLVNTAEEMLHPYPLGRGVLHVRRRYQLANTA